jgi:hypothetical protein
MTNVQVGDVGTILVITVNNAATGLAKDISSATIKKFIFKNPAGEVIERTAIFTTNGSDGNIQYVSIADDFDEEGQYQWQVYLEMPGWSGHSNVDTFGVYKNLTP